MDSDQTTKAVVRQILGKTGINCIIIFRFKGSRGGITQVKVELIGQQRQLIRNVMGPVRLGDVLELMESEREARRLR